MKDQEEKGELIDSDEQLRRWVNGESVHRQIPGCSGGECTPDFSCCNPELLQPKSVREAFAAAPEPRRMEFLGAFLAAAVAAAAPEKRVHIAGQGIGN